MKLIYFYSFLFLLTCFSVAGYSQKEILYVGTYSTRGSEGIYVFEFNRKEISFKKSGSIQTLKSPNFVTLSPDKKFLYSNNSSGIQEFPKYGSVSSFSIDPQSGLLKELSTITSYGKGPCHIELDNSGTYLLVSHYGGGSLSVFSMKNGKIEGLLDSVKHIGSSVNKKRQESAHAHSAQSIPGTDYFMVADLGIDKLKIYGIKNNSVQKAPVAEIKTEPGAGPRHFTFFPGNSKYVFVAEELSSTVSVHYLDVKKGNTKQIQRISTLPASFKEYNKVADIHFSPDGKFLYVSNRGHNSLAIFSVNKKNKKITPVDYQHVKGKTPRNFMVDSKGDFVLVANQDTDNIVFFSRNKKTGKLSETNTELKVPSPVCLKIIEL